MIVLRLVLVPSLVRGVPTASHEEGSEVGVVSSVRQGTLSHCTTTREVEADSPPHRRHLPSTILT